MEINLEELKELRAKQKSRGWDFMMRTPKEFAPLKYTAISRAIGESWVTIDFKEGSIKVQRLTDVFKKQSI